MIDLSGNTISELYGFLAEYLSEGESAFEKSCRVLYELDKKGDKSHPLFKKSIYKHYEIVFRKKVTASLVLYFGGAKKPIQRMTDGYHRDTMNNISAENKFCVAIVRKGEIVKEQYSGHQMDWKTFDRLFPGGGIERSYSEQWTLLNEELENKKIAEAAELEARKNEPVVPRIKAENGKLIINEEVFSLSELNDALQKLGFSIVGN